MAGLGLGVDITAHFLHIIVFVGSGSLVLRRTPGFCLPNLSAMKSISNAETHTATCFVDEMIPERRR